MNRSVNWQDRSIEVGDFIFDPEEPGYAADYVVAHILKRKKTMPNICAECGDTVVYFGLDDTNTTFICKDCYEKLKIDDTYKEAL